MARYIDADSFLKDMICKFHCVPTVTNYECYDGTSLKEVLNLTPAADVAPVVHGKWKHVAGMNSKCSECGHYFPVTEFEKRPFDINYCPYCGAKMDGKDGERE